MEIQISIIDGGNVVRETSRQSKSERIKQLEMCKRNGNNKGKMLKKKK